MLPLTRTFGHAAGGGGVGSLFLARLGDYRIFLVLPGVYNSELMAPYDVLQHLKFLVENAPEIFTVSPDQTAISGNGSSDKAFGTGRKRSAVRSGSFQ